MTEHFDKLVRDRIPAAIREDGGTPSTDRVEGPEYRVRLHDKLAEEVAELRANPSAEEVADVREVLSAILNAEDIDPDRVSEIRAQKAERRGRFEDGIVLNEVEG
jgi:predicted house-cleaning noncanonical NTP pyrophosphatase (MazG superfamily)